MKAWRILLLLKHGGVIFNQNESFWIIFGLFYDFFVFYIVDFFTECFLCVIRLYYHYNKTNEDFICRQIDFIEFVSHHMNCLVWSTCVFAATRRVV